MGLAALAGIGFTVSLFIADLAYDAPALTDTAKIGILGGSLAAALLGAAILFPGRPDVDSAFTRQVSPAAGADPTE